MWSLAASWLLGFTRHRSRHVLNPCTWHCTFSFQANSFLAFGFVTVLAAPMIAVFLLDESCLRCLVDNSVHLNGVWPSGIISPLQTTCDRSWSPGPSENKDWEPIDHNFVHAPLWPNFPGVNALKLCFANIVWICGTLQFGFSLLRLRPSWHQLSNWYKLNHDGNKQQQR